MSESDDLSYDLNELLGIKPPPPPPTADPTMVSMSTLSQNQLHHPQPNGVKLTKANARQLGRKVIKAIRRRNRMKYYLLFSKNIHWIFYWPSVVLGAAAATTAFANWAQEGTCQGIAWINILSGVLAVLGAALTAINGAAKFPEKEANARDSVAAWGKYADKYETLLNRPYRDHGDALRVMDEAITEYAELEQKSPDIPTFVLKLYLRSSLSKEIGDDDADPIFNFESEPELLGGGSDSQNSQPHITNPQLVITRNENSDDLQDDDAIPPLQRALQNQMANSNPSITEKKDKDEL